MADGAVTGVVDWANTIVADPAFDVATTLVILSSCPWSCSACRRPFSGGEAARPLLVAGIFAATGNAGGSIVNACGTTRLPRA